MPITVTRVRSFLNDADGDGVADTGDTFLHTVTIINGEASPLTNLFLTESQNGLTIDPGSFQIGPIAINEDLNDLVGTVQGNTPVTFSAAQLLANDIDPDDTTPNLTITKIGNTSVVDGNGDPIVATVAVTNGTVTSNLDGTFTFKPTTGFEGEASFTYEVTDEQGVTSVASTPGLVSITVSDCVWYVDSNAAAGGDGSYGSALKSLADLSTGGGKDGLDGTGDTIFVYARGADAYTSGIVLEDGQTLRGEGTGTSYSVNGITVSTGAADTQIEYTTFGAEVSNNNTITGIDFVGEGASAVAIRDDTTNVGTLTVSNTEVSGQGQIIDVDNGGTFNVRLDSVASTGSTGNNGGVIDLTGVSGTFDVTGTTSITGSHSQTGIEISGNTNFAVDFEGTTTVQVEQAGSVRLDNNSGTSSTSFDGLNITSTLGFGMWASSAGTLTITGATNSIQTSTGQILNLDSVKVGSGDIAFNTLTSTGTVSGPTAVQLSNVDDNDITIGTVTVAGTSGTGDGINVGTNSATNIAINSVSIGNTGGQAIEINGSTGSFDINTGTITHGVGTDDEAVLISGGSGTVDIGANISKTTVGNVVEVQNHSGGTVTFSGTVSATGNLDNGILLNGNGGTIEFTGSQQTLTTGAFNGVTITGNTANVDFTGGSLDVTTTAGAGISAGTTGTATGGTLTISGSSNTISSGTGHALVVNGTDIDAGGITLLSVNKNGGSNTAVFLKDTGSSGFFTITGSGSTANSGGTIQNISGSDSTPSQGTGYYFENVSNVSLSNLNFDGTINNYGIRGFGVNNFTLRDSTLDATFGTYTGLSGQDEEGAIKFGTNNNGANGLTGTALFEGNTIGANVDTATGMFDNLAIFNNVAGTLNFTMKDSTNDQAVVGKNSNIGNDGVVVQVRGGGTATMLVEGVTFQGSRGDMVQASVQGTGTMTATIKNNTMHNTHADITSGGGGMTISSGENPSNYTLNYEISGNSIRGSEGQAIFISTVGTQGTINGVIANNTIGVNDANRPEASTAQGSTGSSQGNAIDIRNEKFSGSGDLHHAVRIEGNTITDFQQSGIYIRSNNQGGGSGRVEATIKNNTIEEVGPNTNGGISVIASGSTAGDTGKLGLALTGNIVNLQNNVDGPDAGSTIEVGDNNAILIDQIYATGEIYVPGVDASGNGQRGEGRPPVGGQASDRLTTLWGPTNTLVNGEIPLAPGELVDATQVWNLTSNAFVLGVPMLVYNPGNNGWEIDNPLPPPPAPTPDTDSNTDGTETGSGGTDTGSGGTDTGGTDTGGTGTDGGTPAPVAHELTQAELDTLVEAAIERWAAAGATTEQLAAMRAAKFSIADMAGTYLGTSKPGEVLVDSDGAGHGWFVDATPGEDSEFGGSGTRLAADQDGAAAGKMDLLTVLMHELGHQVGLDDIYNGAEADELMYGYARLAERRLPGSDDLAGADMTHAGHESFIESSPTVASLPAGKGVIIRYTSTVIDFVDQKISAFTNKSTAETDNFPDAFSIDENLVVDTLTLGGTVFIDANNDGDYDSGEGVNAVTVTLYADTDDSGGYSTGDAELGTATTNSSGDYVFTGLSDGDYIVRVDATNFGATKPLEGQITGDGDADPDDNNNPDGDDNGVDVASGLGGGVASKTITLDYNTEPTSDGGTPPKNDVNTTLDFGFIDPNDAPVLTVPGSNPTGDEDMRIAVSGVSVSDVDAGTDDVTVTLSIASGKLDVTTTTGLTVTNNNSGLVTLTGSLTDLNNSLATLGYTPVADANGDFTLTVKANDNGNNGPDPGLSGDANSEQDQETVTITVNAVADSDDDTLNDSEDSPGADIMVLGNDEFENSDVKITSFTNPTNGTVELKDNDTPTDFSDDYFFYKPNANFNGTDSFTYTVTSGGVTETATVDIDISGVNDAPTLAGLEASATFLEDAVNAAPALLDSQVSFADVDGNFTGGSVTVSGLLAEDRVAIRNEGTDPGKIGVNGTTVSFGGTAIGTVAGGAGGTLTVTLNGSATSAAVDALIQNLTYANSSDTPTASRELAIQVTDADGATLTGGAKTIDVSVTAENDAPTIELPIFTITRVSTDAAGVQGNAASFDPVFSPDGTKVAFVSAATNLVAGDTNGFRDIFVKDLATGTVTRVSTDAAGGQGNNNSGNNFAERIEFSPDGTKILFESYASNLVSGDTNGRADIFIKDLGTGAITRVSTGATGTQANGDSIRARFSPDGTKVVFESAANNLVAGDTNNRTDIFVKNLVTGAVTLVSTSATGTQGDGGSLFPMFSPDGSKVAFSSLATNLVAGDTNASEDLFVKDLATGAITWVSTDAAGTPGNGQSQLSSFSPDGTKIAFQSLANNLVPGDTNGVADVFVRDLTTGAITRVSTDGTGVQGNNGSFRTFFSPDGGKLIIQSLATNFDTGDVNGAFDIFIKDLTTGAFTRVSTDAAGGFANGSSARAVYSLDASKITFRSDATNLVTGDSNVVSDVFVVGIGAYAPKFVEDGAAKVLNGQATVADPELAALNGGSGDYAGATLTVARQGGANAQDVFSLDLTNALFTISGSDLQSGGQTFATFTSTGGTLTVTFTSSGTEATSALVQDVVRHVAYTNTSGAPPASVTIAMSLDDGNAGSQGAGAAAVGAATTAVSIQAVNDAPSLTPGGDVTVDEDDGAVTMTAWATDISAGPDESDQGLSITTTVQSSDFSFTQAPSVNVVTGNLTFTAAANASGTASIQVVIRDDNGTPGNLADDLSETYTFDITVDPLNDAPTQTGLGGDTVNWNEGDSAVLLDDGGNVSIADIDSADFNGGSLTVSIGTGKVAGEDQLLIEDAGTVTVSAGVVSVGGNQVGTVTGGGAGGGNLVITFTTAFATPDAVEAVMAAVKYNNSGGDNPTDGNRVINWTLVDGDGNAGDSEDTLSVSSNVDVGPTNDAPTLQLSATGPGSTLAYDENDPATALSPTAVFADVDSANFAGGKLEVQFDGGSGQTGDVLSILQTGGITLSGTDVLYNLVDIGDYSIASNVITVNFDSDATVTAVDALIQAIGYRNTLDNPSTASRFVNFKVTEADNQSAQANATVNFAAVDDDATPANDTATVAEDGTIGINVLDNDTDVDGPTPLGVTKIDGQSVSAGGTVTLTGSGAKVTLNNDGTLTYNPFDQFDELANFGSGASNTTDTDSFTYTLGNGGTATVTVTVQGAWSDPHIMLGTAGADDITGTAQDDIFQPGIGADKMTGLDGDDAYTVDNIGDNPIEAFGDGDDTVVTTLAEYQLHKNIENLALIGAALNGTGNQLDNAILGNANANILDGLGGADVMAGEGGDDTYIVQNSGDKANEDVNEGHDTVRSSVGFTLGDNVEDLVLIGNAIKGTGNGEDNAIYGNAKSNVLDGKAGADRMFGGQGDDTYFIDNVGDEAIEAGAGGVDLVRSTVSYRLGDGLNDLGLLGTAGSGTGNSLSNVITGNTQANTIRGLGGNDRISGGDGADRLFGGDGNDRLRGDDGADEYHFNSRFDELQNVDTILGYSVADDTIVLDKWIFKNIAAGGLSAAAFNTGAAASDASDRIIYDSATGELFYDSDGTGGAAQILFARLDIGLALTNADFIAVI